MNVDALVALWSGSDSPPRPARPRRELDAVAAEIRSRFALDLPGDYRRFLTLTDGGQYDHALLHGVGPEDSVLDRCTDLRTGPVLVIGGSGNLDAYVLRPDGTAEVVNLFDLSEVSESYPSFTDLLARQLSGAR